MYDFGDQVAEAFKVTSIDQRRYVFENPEKRFPYAELLNISSDALLVASFLENEHPSVCLGARPRSQNFDILLKLALSYEPVDKVNQSVDNL